MEEREQEEGRGTAVTQRKRAVGRKGRKGGTGHYH